MMFDRLIDCYTLYCHFCKLTDPLLHSSTIVLIVFNEPKITYAGKVIKKTHTMQNLLIIINIKTTCKIYSSHHHHHHQQQHKKQQHASGEITTYKLSKNGQGDQGAFPRGGLPCHSYIAPSPLDRSLDLFSSTSGSQKLLQLHKHPSGQQSSHHRLSTSSSHFTTRWGMSSHTRGVTDHLLSASSYWMKGCLLMCGEVDTHAGPGPPTPTNESGECLPKGEHPRVGYFLGRRVGPPSLHGHGVRLPPHQVTCLEIGKAHSVPHWLGKVLVWLHS